MSIARWNGTTWQPLGSGMDYTVAALTVYNGELIAGGYFSAAGGVTCKYIACWNGTNWQPLGAGMGGGSYPYVCALTVYHGELIAGGSFSEAGGVTCNSIARWNGTAWQPLENGMGGVAHPYVLAFTSYPEKGTTPHLPALFAGGSFLTAGGYSSGRIARYDSWAAQIVKQPVDQATSVGSVAQFTVAAEGYGPFTYQWYRGASALEDGPTEHGSVMSGSDTDALTISKVQQADAGDYRVRVSHCGATFSAPATLTVTPSALRGDLNCDGRIDAFDIDPFVLALTDPTGYEAAFPHCDRQLADISADGSVDAFDIDPFVELLIGG
jgi:hypothetical protein